MTSYQYPQVQGGYRWNLLQRCFNEVGIEPINLSDVWNGDAWVTQLDFSRELTAEEKSKLDTLMADNPTFPPSVSGTKFIIRDVWNQKTYFETAIGIPYRIYYSESVPGSGNVDQIEIHFSTALTTAQRNKVISEYGKLITIK